LRASVLGCGDRANGSRPVFSDDIRPSAALSSYEGGLP
jgi:hypothetical protein